MRLSLKESRMEFTSATKVNRKSGGAERRDLQFRGPFVEARNTVLKQDCHLDWSVPVISCHQHCKLFVG
jgi:hypothetical protein